VLGAFGASVVGGLVAILTTGTGYATSTVTIKSDPTATCFVSVSGKCSYSAATGALADVDTAGGDLAFNVDGWSTDGLQMTVDTGSYQQGLGHYFLENEHGGPFIAQLVDRLGTPWRGVGVKTPVVIFRLKSEGHSGLIAGFAVLKNAQLGEPFFAKEHTGADG